MSIFKHLPLFSGYAIIVTNRCNSHCKMCNRHLHQTKPSEEFESELILKLPHVHFINITGGEPFLRDDIEDIIKYAHKRANRVVISSNGTLDNKIIPIMKKYPKTALRISIEGIGKTNDYIRGIPNGYEKVMNLLEKLKVLGCKDLDISITIHEKNCKDVLPLYKMCKEKGHDFATGVLHENFFFENENNNFWKTNDNSKIVDTLETLCVEMKKSRNFKDRFRYLFNKELIKKLKGEKISFMPCNCGHQFFVLDPFGQILACVGSNEKWVMGNLNNADFYDIWNGLPAKSIKVKCKQCNKNCCMSGNVALAMKRKAFLLLPKIF